MGIKWPIRGGGGGGGGRSLFFEREKSSGGDSHRWLGVLYRLKERKWTDGSKKTFIGGVGV